MEIVWTQEIEDEDFTYFHYKCKPIIWRNHLIYAYHTTDRNSINDKGYCATKISVMTINLKDAISKVRHIRFKYEEPLQKEILLTSSWQFHVSDEEIFLYIGFWLDLNRSEISIANMNQLVAKKEIKTDYYFQNTHLTYNHRSTIECFDKNTNMLMWKIKIKGYLYTDIVFKEDCLIFGTAGNGGALYCVALESGTVLMEYSNGDASQFAWKENSIISRDTKGNLVQIDPYSHQILNELKLKNKLFYAPILVDKDAIYATVHNKKQNIANIICVTSN